MIRFHARRYGNKDFQAHLEVSYFSTQLDNQRQDQPQLTKGFPSLMLPLQNYVFWTLGIVFLSFRMLNRRCHRDDEPGLK